MSAVFLSASVPDPRRNPRYYRAADIARIREAVTQLARSVLPTRELVFGGHPAISPLILAVARQLGATKRVVIYQSDYFRGVVPRDSLAFPVLVWTASTGDRDGSLERMRNEMIGSRTFESSFFIGGMEGVEDELEAFRRAWPTTPVYPVASTGGAAKILWTQGEGPRDPVIRGQLETDLVYGYLFRHLLGP